MSEREACTRTRLMRRKEMEGMSPSVWSCMRKSGLRCVVWKGVVERKGVEIHVYCIVMRSHWESPRRTFFSLEIRSF